MTKELWYVPNGTDGESMSLAVITVGHDNGEYSLF